MAFAGGNETHHHIGLGRRSALSASRVRHEYGQTYIGIAMHLGQHLGGVRQLRKGAGGYKRRRLDTAHACVDQPVNRCDLVRRRDELGLCLKTVAGPDFGDRHKFFGLL